MSGCAHLDAIYKIAYALEKRCELLRNELLFAYERGSHCHDPACPEDDTCDCPEIHRLNYVMARPHEERIP